MCWKPGDKHLPCHSPPIFFLQFIGPSPTSLYHGSFYSLGLSFHRYLLSLFFPVLLSVISARPPLTTDREWHVPYHKELALPSFGITGVQFCPLEVYLLLWCFILLGWSLVHLISIPHLFLSSRHTLPRGREIHSPCQCELIIQ